MNKYSIYNLPVECRLDMAKLLDNRQLFAVQQTARIFGFIDYFKNELAICKLHQLVISAEYYYKRDGEYLPVHCKKELNLDEDVKCQFGGNVYDIVVSDVTREKWENAIIKGISFFMCDNIVYSKGDLKTINAASTYLNFIRTNELGKCLFIEVPHRPRSIADMFFMHFWLKQIMGCLILDATNLGIPAMFNVQMLHLLFDDYNIPIQFHINTAFLLMTSWQSMEFALEHLKINSCLDLREGSKTDEFLRLCLKGKCIAKLKIKTMFLREFNQLLMYFVCPPFALMTALTRLGIESTRGINLTS